MGCEGFPGISDAKIESSQKGPKWVKSMDYSPWFYSIFGHFETSYFPPEIYFKDPIIHSKWVLKVFQGHLRPKSKVLRRVQNGSKAWTMVHGLTRFLDILKMSIFLLTFTFKALLSTVKEY